MKKLISILYIFFIVCLISNQGLAQNFPGQPVLQQKKIGLAVLKDNKDYQDAREAFLNFLKTKGDLSVEFKLLDAQGDMDFYIRGIDELINQDQVDLIFTTGTRSTLPVVQRAEERVIVVFTAVADPVSSGIVTSLEKRDKKVTGTHCMIPAYAQIKTILKVFPDIRTLGIVYTKDEPNAEIQLKDFQQRADDLNLQVVTSFVSKECRSEEEIALATKEIIHQVDILIVLQDTSLSRYGKGLIDVASEHKLPVYSSLNHLLSSGALFSLGVNFSNIGLMAGQQAYRIFAQGEKPQELTVTTDKKYLLAINLKAARELGIIVPIQVLRTASSIIR